MNIAQENWPTAIPGFPISSLIAVGGMATVYRATQSSLDRSVALKVISVQEGADPNFITLFQREAKTMAQLDQPNICKVYDFGYHEPFLYLVMEDIQGGSMYDHIQAGNLTHESSLAYFAAICQGLAYAHSEGVLHHDIKPSNAMIDQKGVAKLVDFGLATLAGQEEEDVYGTPGYVAPERLVTGAVVDHRADVYSMGALLFEMFTGKPPLDYQPASKISGSPVGYDRVIERCLQTKSEDRYEHIPALLADLKKAASLAGGARKMVTGGTKATSAAATPALASPPKKKGPVVQRSHSPEKAKVVVQKSGGEASTEASVEGRADAIMMREKAAKDEKTRKAILWSAMALLLLFAAIAGLAIWNKVGGEDPVPSEEAAPPSPEPTPAAPDPAPAPAPAPAPTPEPAAVAQEPSPYADPEQRAFIDHSLPGLIEAENFDHGGLGIAYEDDEDQHAQDKDLYRQGDTGMEAYRENDDESYRIGNNREGDWVEYTIAKIEKGSYRLTAKLGSPGEKSTPALEFLLDGKSIATMENLPTTGGYGQIQELFVADFDLEEGENRILRVKFLISDAYDLDAFRFQKLD